MFMKERFAPELLESLPRLMQRLPRNHAAYVAVEQDHYNTRAGFGGEQQVDHLLRRAKWREPLLAIGDLQLAAQLCQIDTIVVTPHFALVLEVKNFSGTLSFDEKSLHMKQETRDGKVAGYNSPITQALNAQEEVNDIFEECAVSLPVFACVVLPYSTTLIDQAPTAVPVIYGYSLKRFISTLPRTDSPLSPEEMAHVSQLLIDRHNPFSTKNFQEWYRFSLADLKKGVLCVVCGSRCSKASQRMFFCSVCKLPVRDGYARALADWFDFAAPEITNAQCREFLGLKDKYAARYVLDRLGLGRRGTGRGVRYYR
ncbi:nuclease-related domain-containing protein [Planococcus sp. APC 3906]|uniref:nuclease-related domain-containing protein n=1 Tax=Planococcus sp. APC 3906 TaxID=3035194 RepID=UPI0025B506B4|nr:nuclease-related domain-containing protein [Planococcus sp. APC 3906]MDN3451564.1 nuclease-related domain-containing protein [Planococcus sp. APC 3906]